jgi:nucleotide-binding universal stress UspA family protein
MLRSTLGPSEPSTKGAIAVLDPRAILVPVDGSPAAQTALDLALRIAAAAGSRLTVVHASPELAEEVFEQNPLRRVEDEEVAADLVLRDAVRQAEDVGVAVQARIVGERGAEEIADAALGIAQSVGADLIVMGSRGRGLLTEAIVGSVSRSVAGSASIPVVVVHTPAVHPA